MDDSDFLNAASVVIDAMAKTHGGRQMLVDLNAELKRIDESFPQSRTQSGGPV